MYNRRNRRRAPKRKSFKPRQRKLKYNARSVTNVKAVKKVVRNMLSRDQETKIQTMDWVLNPLCLQNGTATLGGNYVVLNPSDATFGGYSINRGTGSGQMIGDKIRKKSAVLDFVITCLPFNASNNTQPRPSYIRAYIYKYKKAPQNDPQVTNICGSGINANFFDMGTTDIGFTGTLEDLNQRMNTDAYTYLAHRTWKIGNAIPQAGTNNTQPIYTYANNDFKYSAFGKWNVTKYLPQIMNRDDDAKWMNDYVVLLFQVICADGTTYGTTQIPFRVNLGLVLKYTDS